MTENTFDQGQTPRTIALYLPQFHPIPENDLWWGEGFTEWSSVVAARPRFSTHYQPHLPADDLGYYDLRSPAARDFQAQLMTVYAVDGLCYYHYWFGGRRLLEQPLNEVLRLGKPGTAFALCWANESWRRNWDGRTGEILIEETYSDMDDVVHARYLAEIFGDDRYLKVSGRPIFLIYKASRLPHPLRTTDHIRSAATASGLNEPLIVRVESARTEHGEPASYGCDAAVDFVPDLFRLPRAIRAFARESFARAGIISDARLPDTRRSYGRAMKRALGQPSVPYLRFPCVMPGWDNSPRRGSGAVIYNGSTPDLYGKWLEETLVREARHNGAKSLVFVNAWNEWGEGAHLEPDQRWGRAYLEAHLAAVTGASRRLRD
jgi:lipopolysaccharide biosynthesis protein